MTGRQDKKRLHVGETLDHQIVNLVCQGKEGRLLVDECMKADYLASRLSQRPPLHLLHQVLKIIRSTQIEQRDCNRKTVRILSIQPELRYLNELNAVLPLGPQEMPDGIDRYLELSHRDEATALTQMVLPSMALETTITHGFIRQNTMDLQGILLVTVRHRNLEIESQIAMVIDT